MHHLVSGLLFSGFLCCCLIGFTKFRTTAILFKGVYDIKYAATFITK